MLAGIDIMVRAFFLRNIGIGAHRSDAA